MHNRSGVIMVGRSADRIAAAAPAGRTARAAAIRGAHRVILALAVSLPVVAHAGLGFWTSGGPNGGYATRIEVDPLTPSRVYVSSYGGLYRTLDSGASFQRIENGLPGGSYFSVPIAIDRQSPTRVYAAVASGSVFRSSDAGDNWSATGFTLTAPDCVNLVLDGLGTDEVFLGTCASGVRRSTDAGVTFSSSSGLPTNEYVLSIAQDPADPTRMLAAMSYYDTGPGGVFRSTDRGATWTPVAGITTPSNCTTVAFAGSGAYAGCDGSLYKSVDSGANWTVVNGGVAGNDFKVSPADPNTLFVAGDGVSRVLVSGSTATLSALNGGLVPNPTYGGALTGYSIALHPSFPSTSVLWTATGAGVYRSIDGGIAWQPRNNGMRANVVRSIAINPNPGTLPGNRRVLAGIFNDLAAGYQLFLSTDNTSTWDATSVSGLQSAGLRAIRIDPTTAGSVASTRVYANGRAQFDNILGLNGGLYRSLDGGDSWQNIDNGLPSTGSPPVRAVGIGRALVLDRRSCAAPPVSGPCTSGPLRTAWAGGSGRSRIAPAPPGRGWRILKTTNLELLAAPGPTWTDVDGLPQPVGDESLFVVQLAIDPNDGDTVYASTFISLFATSAPSSPNGVFKTSNGGTTWTNVSTGLPRLLGSTTTSWDVMALVHHPTDSGVLWAATTALGDSSAPAASRIYKTTDGGANWVRSDTGIPTNVDLRAMLVDPGAPNIIYAGGIGSAGNPGGVYRSSDGGANWRSISIGLPSAAVLALALDPVNATLVHAGTTSGVWSLTQVGDGDGDGAPNQQENNAPNGGDGNGDGAPDALQGDVGSSIVLDNDALPRPKGVFDCTGSFTTDVLGSTCPQAVDVTGLTAARYGRDFLNGSAGRAYQYSLDLVRFQLPNCGSADVEVTFHLAGSDPAVCPDFNDYQWSFRFYGPQVPGNDATVGWYDFTSRATRVGPRKWRLRLDANQFGSYRPVNDTILFIGGPALSGDRVFGNGFE